MNNGQNLQICFAWHPLDEGTVKPILNYSSDILSRNPKMPFSRNINIPVRYLTSLTKAVPDISYLKDCESDTIVFVFVGRNIVSDDKWFDFVEMLPRKKNYKKVAIIALDKYAFKLNDAYDVENFIRYKDYKDKTREIFVAMAHVIYMQIADSNIDKDVRIRLFLSHTKADKYAVQLVRNFKRYLDGRTTIKNFFDATDILPGEKTGDELERAIEDTTFIAFQSDNYAQSYWCQKEVLKAKEKNRPMIAVDTIQTVEDRGFPYLGNTPRVRIDVNGKADYINILVNAIVETLRFRMYQWRYSEDKNIIKLSRPPEMQDVVKACKEKKKIAYPEPKLFLDEESFLKNAGEVEFVLPHEQYTHLRGKRIGISISDSDEEDMLRVGIRNRQLEQLSKMIAERLMGGQAKLIYGGDFRRNGITTFILEEVRILQDRSKSENYYEVNSAWPLYLKQDAKTNDWLAEAKGIAEIIKHDIPDDLKGKVLDSDHFVSPKTLLDKYAWSRSLTAMRESMICKDDARIFACGKLCQYKGCMPGVLEEFLIAYKCRKPIYLLGAYGGITKILCEFLLQKHDKLPCELTRKWQEENTSGLNELWGMYSKFGVELFSFEDELKSVTLEELSKNNGLEVEENIKLFNTFFVDDACYFIEKGMMKCDNS